MEDFLEYLASEFKKDCKVEKDYLVSSIFTEIALSYFDEFDGVIYESTRAVDDELRNIKCVAIKPSVVDSQMKHFSSVLYIMFYFKNDKEYMGGPIGKLVIEEVCDGINDNNDFVFCDGQQQKQFDRLFYNKVHKS